MNDFQPTYKQFGERSILVEWPSKIDENILESIIFFKEKLENSLLKELIQIKSAYNSILISYDYTIDNIYDEILTLKELYLTKDPIIKYSFAKNG